MARRKGAAAAASTLKEFNPHARIESPYVLGGASVRAFVRLTAEEAAFLQDLPGMSDPAVENLATRLDKTHTVASQAAEKHARMRVGVADIAALQTMLPPVVEVRPVANQEIAYQLTLVFGAAELAIRRAAQDPQYSV